jgi:Fur family zinc uptake transcriptional regulator
MPVRRRSDGKKRAPPESPGGRIEAEVLRILAAAPQPLGAYDMLPIMSRSEGRPVYPNQVYRALDRLEGARLVERVESLSRYMLRRANPAVILICTLCGGTTQVEGSALHDMLSSVAERHSFATERAIVEVLGRCGACDSSQPV